MLTRVEAPKDTAHDTPAATSAWADPRPLHGRLALVTGSTSGIGLGIAGALAAAGAGVVLNGFGEADAIARLVSELSDAHGVEVTHAHADLSSSAEINALIGRVTARRGAIDILVNNAGIQHVAPIAEFPPERWEAVLAINLTAAFLLTRRVFAVMMAEGYGRIVNISSAHGLIASPFKAAYVTAKHGLIGLTKVTALEGAEHGVTANAICPGYVWTPLVERQIEDQARAHGIDRDSVIRDVLLAQQPNKRFATAEEIGALTVFLCTDAAVSITGTALPVDGGWTAH